MFYDYIPLEYNNGRYSLVVSITKLVRAELGCGSDSQLARLESTSNPRTSGYKVGIQSNYMDIDNSQ